MKILHTADWHLGKIVNSVHMTEEQDYILEKLLDIIEQEQPDVLIIAGDIYDRAIPPRDAVELLNKVLTTVITTYNIPILAIAGNHDSPDRLEFGNQLFRAQNLFIETKITADLKPIIIHDDNGPVYFHLIPYTEPAEVREYFADDKINSHHSAMEAMINHIKNNHDMSERHILIGHAFLAGGMESESEERLSMIGGSPYIDAALFHDFTYVAMGHLHQPQRVTSDTIRYSGSLLKYSFSESNHRKSVTMVDLDENKQVELEYFPLIPRYDMRIVEGYFDELIEHPLKNHEDFLHIQLLDEGKIIDPMNKLRKIYPNILRLERITKRSDHQLLDLKKVREENEKSHTELFTSFYKEIRGEEMDDKRISRINQVISKIVEDERGK